MAGRLSRRLRQVAGEPGQVDGEGNGVVGLVHVNARSARLGGAGDSENVSSRTDKQPVDDQTRRIERGYIADGGEAGSVEVRGEGEIGPGPTGRADVTGRYAGQPVTQTTGIGEGDENG